MYNIKIYEKQDETCELSDWLMGLNKRAKTVKDARVRLKKIYQYIELLQEYGTELGEPMIRHITGTDLWELRPFRDRIFFAAYGERQFVLLHHFTKKTEKTPMREIRLAQKKLWDLWERGV